MLVAKARLKSLSPYSQSKHYKAEKLQSGQESPADFEARTWRERCHYNSDEVVVIPPMQFKKSLDAAAKYLSIKIQGQRNKTWTKKFLAGVMVVEPVPLGVTKDKIDHEWLFVPSDGKPGGGTRVEKCFPLIHEWEADVEYHILDEIITEDIFRAHLEASGSFVGLGRFRPASGGYYGRFGVVGIDWPNGQ